MGIGRNDPCPCGSGKKHKQCCLNKQENHKASIGLQQKYELAKSSVLMKIGDMMVSSEYVQDLKRAENVYFALKENVETITDLDKLSFYSWFVQDYMLHSQKYFIDLFVDNKGKSLDEEELILANEMQNVSQRVYEIRSITPEEGLLLQDIYEGHEYFIKDSKIASSSEVGDIIAIRVIAVGEAYQPIGLGPYISRRHKQAILKWLETEFKKAQQMQPEISFNNFMRRNSLRFLYFYERLVGEPKAPAKPPVVEENKTEQIFMAEDEVMDLLKQNMKRPYIHGDVEKAINYWVMFKSDNPDVKGKPEGFAAGLEYLVNKELDLGLSQIHIGEKYDVSSSTVAKRYKEVNEYLFKGRGLNES